MTDDIKEGEEVYCHECSLAGGAERAIYHLPPVCKTTLSTSGTVTGRIQCKKPNYSDKPRSKSDVK